MGEGIVGGETCFSTTLGEKKTYFNRGLRCVQRRLVFLELHEDKAR